MQHTFLCTTPSDSHQWNLVFLREWLRERGAAVTCPGVCVPIPQLVARIQESKAKLVVVSTINGHGGIELLQLAAAIRGCPALDGVTIVAGGKLALAPEQVERAAARLRGAGVDHVLVGADALGKLDRLLGNPARTLRGATALRPTGTDAPASGGQA